MEIEGVIAECDRQAFAVSAMCVAIALVAMTLLPSALREPSGVRRLRFLTPDVAIVDIDTEVHGVKAMPGGIVVPPDGVVKTQLMEVFVRRDGQWWVEAYHNVDVKPAAKP
jgi:hypothetical protein